MNYEPLQDFYCVPQSEAEAKEIIERAVAHGAELIDRTGVNNPEEEEYLWDVFCAWGAYKGLT